MATQSMESVKRRPYTALILFCVIALLTFGYVFDYSYESAFQRVHTTSLKLLSTLSSKDTEGDEPLIYIYNSLFDSKDWYSYWKKCGKSKFVRTLGHCPTKCRFTTKTNLMKSADFVLVSIAAYKYYAGRSVKLRYSRGYQKWIAFVIESPYYGQGYEAVDRSFDWVATYRRDSDIFVPYGHFYPINASVSRTAVNMQAALKQKKLAAWLVSKCNTKGERDKLVTTLQRYIPVDVFGKCSKRKCPETKKLSCRDYLGQNYKFYLAFENSLCLDYVTEKLFLSYQYNMVPVTFGWVDYALYGPPGSYINALDYDSVEDLAKYLLYLDKNDEEYLKYFEWKENYKVQFFHVEDQLCIVCKAASN